MMIKYIHNNEEIDIQTIRHLFLLFHILYEEEDKNKPLAEFEKFLQLHSISKETTA